MMSLLVMYFGDIFCVSRKGGTPITPGWGYPKGAISMVVSVLSFRKALIRTVRVVSLLLGMIGVRKKILLSC